MFRTVSLSIIRSLFTVHSAMIYVEQVCKTAFEQDQDGTVVPSWSCSKAVWLIPLLSVQWINCWWWTEELSETCRVSCQNKFVKLVHLVGFIIKRTVITFHNMNTMGDSYNHCGHSRGNGMTIWEESWMQSCESPSLLSYSQISYSVVHFKNAGKWDRHRNIRQQ